MNEQKIEAHKVTKPIQLLAAWLVGLILIDGMFLIAADRMPSDSWERGAFTISAIVYVPLFLLSMLLLQTKFRPELQEDTFYAEYISKKGPEKIRVEKKEEHDAKLEALERRLVALTEIASHSKAENTNSTKNLDWGNWRIGVNKLLPEYSNIRKALRDRNIYVASIFGNHEAPHPEKWVISISEYLPDNYKADILKSVADFGIDGFQVWEPRREADENEDVYIGSYDEKYYAPINRELLALLNSGAEWADIHDFYQSNYGKFGIKA
jgi:hypothetical protein